MSRAAHFFSGRRRAGCGLAWALALVACSTPGISTDGARRQTLVIALHTVPGRLDVHLQNELGSIIVLSNIYEALVAFDADLRVEPALARLWENPDELTWRFTLRDDVVFHDGRPLSAADVAFSLRRALELPGTRVAGYLSSVDEVQVVDPRTLEIRTRQPDPLLLNKLTHVFVVPDDSPATIDEPVGTGRYRWLSRDDSGVTLAVFRGHRAGPPRFESVRFEFVPERAKRLELLRSGHVDLANRFRPEDRSRLAGASDVEVVSRPGLLVSCLQLRSDAAPFDDVRVRRAVDLALDRSGLVETTIGGSGQPAAQVVAPPVFGFAPDVGASRRDLVEARRLLAEAGYHGEPEVTLEYSEGLQLDPVLAQLREAGFRVVPGPQPFPDLLARLERHEPVLAYLGWIASTGDALDTLEDLVHTPTADGRFGSANWTGLADPELDAILEAAAAARQLTQRRKLLQEGLRRLDAAKVQIPLYVHDDIYGMRAGLTWRPRLDAWILAADVG